MRLWKESDIQRNAYNYAEQTKSGGRGTVQNILSQINIVYMYIVYNTKKQNIQTVYQMYCIGIKYIVYFVKLHSNWQLWFSCKQNWQFKVCFGKVYSGSRYTVYAGHKTWFSKRQTKLLGTREYLAFSPCPFTQI